MTKVTLFSAHFPYNCMPFFYQNDIFKTILTIYELNVATRRIILLGFPENFMREIWPEKINSYKVGEL